MFMGESAGPGDPQLVAMAGPLTGHPGRGLLADATMLCPTVSPRQPKQPWGKRDAPTLWLHPTAAHPASAPVRMRPVCPEEQDGGRSEGLLPFEHRQEPSEEKLPPPREPGAGIALFGAVSSSCRAAMARLTAQEFTGSLRGVTAGSSGQGVLGWHRAVVGDKGPGVAPGRGG